MSENSYMGQLIYKRILTKYKLTFHSDKDKVLKENLKRVVLTAQTYENRP